jgi:hypothetical protein
VGPADGETVVDWWSIAGLVGTIVFGLLSLYQSIERREQKRAIKVFTQGLYDNLWRMGQVPKSC